MCHRMYGTLFRGITPTIFKRPLSHVCFPGVGPCVVLSTLAMLVFILWIKMKQLLKKVWPLTKNKRISYSLFDNNSWDFGYKFK